MEIQYASEAALRAHLKLEIMNVKKTSKIIYLFHPALFTCTGASMEEAENWT